MKNVIHYFKQSTLVLLTAFSCTLTFAEPPNLDLLKKDIRQWHDAGLYVQEVDQQIEQARRYILEQVQNNQKKAKQDALAVVLDIDETSLSNYKFIDHSDFANNRQMVEEHILAADSPAIESMLKLYQDAQRHGVKMFFVTGRNASFKEATELNLSKAGYNQWEDIYFKPAAYSNPSSAPYKTQARIDIEKRGFVIIANIGDQYSDLLGGHAQKTVKLPNPFYFLP